MGYINLFFFFSFLGFVWETAWVSLNEKKFANRGFLKGPILPIYGFGAISVIFSTRNLYNKLSIFIVGSIIATILELITGWAIEKLFKIRYWDYDERFLNYKGYICLRSSLFWGFISIFLYDLTYKFVMPKIKIYENSNISFISYILIFLFLLDTYLSIKDAYGFRKLIEMEEKAEAYKKVLKENLDQKRKNLDEKIDEIKDDSLEIRRELERNFSENIKDYVKKSKDKELRFRNRILSLIESYEFRKEENKERLIQIINGYYKERIKKYKKLERNISKLSKRNKLSYRFKNKD
ncbi:hypothetical protein HV819_11145 [Anaerococcus sp. AGMB00486]|uniref:ABC transporter permease n=2 Tax=Anaerococcus TaxID=165779 RepID=A0ABX2NCW1_9FIRM|nr:MULTISPECIES: putative ABC transporter permease [Anaerococcus]MSS77856.1 hypothetical protein [Anaerococcus porci]NVF12511.1 hypothetical protein [Anaerococcus faecalis]